jgi:hypothetical protein
MAQIEEDTAYDPVLLLGQSLARSSDGLQQTADGAVLEAPLPDGRMVSCFATRHASNVWVQQVVFQR